MSLAFAVFLVCIRDCNCPVQDTNHIVNIVKPLQICCIPLKWMHLRNSCVKRTQTTSNAAQRQPSPQADLLQRYCPFMASMAPSEASKPSKLTKPKPLLAPVSGSRMILGVAMTIPKALKVSYSSCRERAWLETHVRTANTIWNYCTCRHSLASAT